MWIICKQIINVPALKKCCNWSICVLSNGLPLSWSASSFLFCGLRGVSLSSKFRSTENWCKMALFTALGTRTISWSYFILYLNWAVSGWVMLIALACPYLGICDIELVYLWNIKDLTILRFYKEKCVLPCFEDQFKSGVVGWTPFVLLLQWEVFFSDETWWAWCSLPRLL